MVLGQTEQQIRATYDAVADTYADHFRSTEPEDAADLRMIGAFVSLLPPSPQVLDAGCGAGRMLPFLHGLGCQAEGIDLSSDMVRRAQGDHPTFRTQMASLLDLPFADGHFDGALYWYSTIHTPDDGLPAVLDEARRVVRPGGYICVGFQTGIGVVDVSGGYRARGHDVRLLRYNRSAASLADALQRGGFTEHSRLDRGPRNSEQDGQAVLIAQR